MCLSTHTRESHAPFNRVPSPKPLPLVCSLRPRYLIVMKLISIATIWTMSHKKKSKHQIRRFNITKWCQVGTQLWRRVCILIPERWIGVVGCGSGKGNENRQLNWLDVPWIHLQCVRSFFGSLKLWKTVSWR